jgi:ketosteroid isomerase-like protein
MHPNAETIERFYTSFAKRDAEGMVAHYHADVTFSDPVFVGLRGDRARSMWRMLTERAKDIRLEFSGIEADDTMGRAHWEARYTFSATGRPVHNVIDARFTFAGGLIKDHTDDFDLWRWAGMALGAKGKLLGWTPLVKGAIRKNAARGLDDWMSKNAPR